MIDYFNGAHNAAEEHFRDCGASTLDECIRDDARRYGAENEDVEWIYNDFDTYTHTPYYTALPTLHPEERGGYGDEPEAIAGEEAREMQLKIDFAVRKYLAIVLPPAPVPVHRGPVDDGVPF